MCNIIYTYAVYLLTWLSLTHSTLLRFPINKCYVQVFARNIQHLFNSHEISLPDLNVTVEYIMSIDLNLAQHSSYIIFSNVAAAVTSIIFPKNASLYNHLCLLGSRCHQRDWSFFFTAWFNFFPFYNQLVTLVVHPLWRHELSIASAIWSEADDLVTEVTGVRVTLNWRKGVDSTEAGNINP